MARAKEAFCLRCNWTRSREICTADRRLLGSGIMMDLGSLDATRVGCRMPPRCVSSQLPLCPSGHCMRRSAMFNHVQRLGDKVRDAFHARHLCVRRCQKIICSYEYILTKIRCLQRDRQQRVYLRSTNLSLYCRVTCTGAETTHSASCCCCRAPRSGCKHLCAAIREGAGILYWGGWLPVCGQPAHR